METIAFEKNKDLFNNNLSTGISFNSKLDLVTLNAIKNNEKIENLPLPLIIGDGKVEASGDNKTFEFKGNKSIALDGSVEAKMRVGIFSDLETLTNDLSSNDDINIDTATVLDEDCMYVLFSIGYRISANVEANWILNAGSIGLGIDGQRKKRMVVIKSFKSNEGVKSAIKATIGELKSPKQIKKNEDLSGGTVIAIETEGSLEGSLKAMAGHEFNWLYESDIEGLEGTVGLDAKLGAQIGLGFSMAGKYALLLSRKQNDDWVVVNLHKKKRNGWDFALSLDASLKGELDDKLRNTSMDNLIKATLGIHHKQVMEYLKFLEPDHLTQFLEKLPAKLLKKLADNTQVDESIAQIQSKVLDLINKWDGLDEKVSATLWKLLDDNAAKHLEIDLDQIHEDIQTLAKPNNKEEITKLLESTLSDVAFMEKPFGQLLNGLVSNDDIIGVVVENQKFEELQSKASKLLEVLNVKDRLSSFHEVVSTELKLDKIKKAAEQDSFDQIGGWLEELIADLIKSDNGQLVMGKLEEVNKFITSMRSKAKDIFEKTKKAMENEYGASLSYSYQKETEKTALIKAGFNLTKPAVKKIFNAALNGDYNTLLVEPTDGIKLYQGVLTHRVTKEKTVALSLPMMKRDLKHINDALATGNFIDEENGRLVMFDLEAEDIKRKSKRLSQMALEGYYRQLITQHDLTKPQTLISTSYSFRLAKDKLSTRHLEQIVIPFIKTYLNNTFKDSPVFDQPSINAWTEQLARQIDAVKHNGEKRFGRSMINLQVRVPSTIGSAWFKAPSDFKDEIYIAVSNAIQTKLREVLPIFYLADEQVFKDQFVDELDPLLVYASLPVKTEFKYGSKKVKEVLNRAKYLNNNLRNIKTAVKLTRLVDQIKTRLMAETDPEIHRLHTKFKPDDPDYISGIISKIEREEFNADLKLMALIDFEHDFIKNIIEECTKLGRFVEKADKTPQQAIAVLQDFGANMTNIFNKAPKKLLGRNKDYSRYIGSELFITVAQVFDPALISNTQGSLELLVAKEDSSFDLSKYLDGEKPAKEDLILAQRIFDIE